MTHVVPLVRTLQRAWPGLPMHWVIDKGGYKLLEGLEGVVFHTYDKKSGLAGMRALRKELPVEGFDVLLQMQVAFRANVLSGFIPAKRRVGYDRARAKDLHGLFINERIPDRPGIHVLDAIGSFCEPLGLKQTDVSWDLPVPAEAREWARAQWADDGAPVLMISPCSSHVRRNWYADRYAAVADHAAARGWRIVLCGGRSELERSTTDAIMAAMQHPALDLVGKDTLKQLPALLESRWAAARAAALEALGPELDADTLEAALLDKAARVRAAAQELASQRGIAPDRFYLDHWSASHHPRSLLAAARLGARCVTPIIGCGPPRRR